jgi:hypothetical protein
MIHILVWSSSASGAARISIMSTYPLIATALLHPCRRGWHRVEIQLVFGSCGAFLPSDETLDAEEQSRGIRTAGVTI